MILVPEPTSFLDAYALIKAAHIEKKLDNFSVLVNMAENASLAKQNFNKFLHVCKQFLDVNLHYAGMIPVSSAIRRSIVKRSPITVSQPSSKEAKAFTGIAEEIMDAPVNQHDGIRFCHSDAEIKYE